MRKFVSCFLLFFAVCVAFAGSFSAGVLLYCALISAGAAAATVFIFKFTFSFGFNSLKFVLYFAVLLKSIYLSSFKTLFLFIRSQGTAGVELVDVPLKTQKSLFRLLICQSITLTPGTVPVNSKAGTVSILKFETDSLENVEEFDNLLKGV